MFQGAADQRCRLDFWLCSDTKPLSARNDVLVFQTPPLASDIEVTGRLIVKLWASSDALDTDFTAKLVDVYPPNADFPSGIDLNIADSIVRARYRNGFGKAELLKPGQPYEFTIEMYPTSLVFKKGHHIRLDISSSNFPRFDINPNTGEPLNNNRRSQVAGNTIYLDAKHPSQIVLPVIPAETTDTSASGSGGNDGRLRMRSGQSALFLGSKPEVIRRRTLDRIGGFQRAKRDVVQKSASRRSLLISSKPVYAQLGNRQRSESTVREHTRVYRYQSAPSSSG